MEALAASQLVSGHWYVAANNGDYLTYKLPPEERTWAFKVQGHALPTAQQAQLMFPNSNYSPKCALCKGADNTATHWYDCPALQEVWREELAIVDKCAPLRGDGKWQEIAN